MKKIFLPILAVFFIALSSFAQEGMWMLSQIERLELKNKGLEIEVSDIYSPDKPALYNAVVQLGGGTASFVSPEGLLLTNHHVAFNAIQRASTSEKDYLKNGFLARTRSDEIQAPGYRALVLMEVKDVTSVINESLKGISNADERDIMKDKKINEISESARNGREDINALVAEMYEGKQFILYVYRLFSDIRIVYAPPVSIGKYGGETDNWMWPRHTGDFSFLRVYCAPDGSGRPYNPDNVPYKPAVWLKPAKDDLKDGDFTFVVGFPGFTTRYRSSNSVHWNLTRNYPYSIQNFREIISLIDEITKNNEEGKLKAAGLRGGLSNALKNYEGKVSGMKKTNFLQKKYDFEREFNGWVNSDASRKSKYGDLITKEKEFYDILEKTKDKDNVLGLYQGLAGGALSSAFQLYYIKKELSKPESERQPNISERTLKRAVDNLETNYISYFEPLEKALFIRALKKASELPPGQRIQGLEFIFTGGRSIESFADDAFGRTGFSSLEYARSMYSKSISEIESSDDPFLIIAASLYPEIIEQQASYRTFGANVTSIRKIYIEALYEWKGEGLYPDANGTMRFAYGPVRGYKPADAVWYNPFTTLKGVIEKNTGEEPFNAPEELVELYNKKDFGNWVDPELKDVPVAFTHLCETTGGNSGSPIMNAKGELVGVCFDGNYEAMISDWQFDYELQRTISVDIRYVLFITEKFGKAGFILEEMGVK